MCEGSNISTCGKNFVGDRRWGHEGWNGGGGRDMVRGGRWGRF